MLAGRALILSVVALGLSVPDSQVIAAQEGVPYCHSHAGINFPDFMAMWDYGNPAVTEKKFQALLNLAANSQDKTYMSELLSQIARTYVMRGEHKEAEFFLEQSQLYLSDSEPRLKLTTCEKKPAYCLIKAGSRKR